MSNINESQFFHGSSHWFKPGERVDPTVDRLYGGEPKAFATPSLEVAGNFAHAAVNRGSGRRKPVQGALFAPIYEVEPINPQQSLTGGSSVYSTEGLVVKRIAGYSKTDDLADDASYRGKRELL